MVRPGLFNVLRLFSFSQWFCVPFILVNPSSANITVAAVTMLHQEPWLGRLELEDAGCWVDELLLLVTLPRRRPGKVWGWGGAVLVWGRVLKCDATPAERRGGVLPGVLPAGALLGQRRPGEDHLLRGRPALPDPGPPVTHHRRRRGFHQYLRSAPPTFAAPPPPTSHPPLWRFFQTGTRPAMAPPRRLSGGSPGTSCPSSSSTSARSTSPWWGSAPSPPPSCPRLTPCCSRPPPSWGGTSSRTSSTRG